MKRLGVANSDDKKSNRNFRNSECLVPLSFYRDMGKKSAFNLLILLITFLNVSTSSYGQCVQ